MGYLESNESLKVLLPHEDLEVSLENLVSFFKTMYERQEIWHKRYSGLSQPWTKDEILGNYKFTNVYRELDRNSQFQIERILKVEKDRTQLIWKLMFFRFFNSPDFFTYMENFNDKADLFEKKSKTFVGMIPTYEEFNPNELKNIMEHFRATGGNPFTNAYLTNSQGCPGNTRDECFAFHVIPTLHKMIPEICLTLKSAKTPEEIIKLLMKLPSVSNFMAHEFYQDFTYAERYSDIQIMKFDQNDFTNVGPGAEAGIRLIFPNRKSSKEKLQAIYDLRDMSSEYLKKFGDFKYLGYNSISGKYFVDYMQELTLHNVEMWLCEYQKYWKMKVGLGKQRSKFKPRNSK